MGPARRVIGAGASISGSLSTQPDGSQTSDEVEVTEARGEAAWSPTAGGRALWRSARADEVTGDPDQTQPLPPQVPHPVEPDETKVRGEASWRSEGARASLATEPTLAAETLLGRLSRRQSTWATQKSPVG
jgi:hypothetical protein